MEPVPSALYSQRSVSGRVLAIPELLEEILWQVSHKASLRSAALVCIGWSEFALDALWDDGVSVRGLLGLLGSLNWDRDSEQWGFCMVPRPHDWERFQKYNKRIRKFSCYEDGTDFSLVYLMVSMMKPPGPLLPNLRTLVTDINPEAVVLFGHTGVEEYVLDHEEQSQPERYVRKLRILLHTLPTSLPALRIFSIANVHSECQPVPGDFVYATAQLRELKKLYLPASLLYYPTVSAMSRFSKLEDLTNHGMDGAGPRLRQDMDSDGFAALTRVDLEASYEDACTYIERVFHRSDIKSIAFESPWGDEPASFVRLIGRIARRWPSLEKISIACDGNRPDFVQPPFSAIEPLLACTRLTSLTLKMSAQVSMGDEDYLRLLVALPLLLRLDLHVGARPSQPVPPLRMDTLSSISTHCPDLEDLGIYMDFREPCHPAFDAAVEKCRRLKRLDVHCSPISGSAYVALFMMRLLHPCCKLVVPEKGWEGVVDAMRKGHMAVKGG